MLDAETWDALKASGYTEEELLAEQPFGPIISSYTRAQAIEDGVLVDLTQPSTAKLVREAGFTIPVAMTTTAFSEAVGPIDTELPAGQSINGRLWDVLMLLRFAVRKSGGTTDRVHFKVEVDVDGTGQNRKVVNLWALVGPGDTPDPVLTIMLEGED
jgi:hypothetical protein